MYLHFRVPPIHALAVGMKDGEHSFEIDPSKVEAPLRESIARVVATQHPGMNHYGEVCPTSATLEDFIEAHLSRCAKEVEDQEAKERAEREKREERTARDAATAREVAAALETFKALPGWQAYEEGTLSQDARSALRGSFPWRDEVRRRKELREAAIRAEQRVAIAAMMDPVELAMFDANVLDETEGNLRQELYIFGAALVERDTSRFEAFKSLDEAQGRKYTREEWLQREARLAMLYPCEGCTGWTYNTETVMAKLDKVWIPCVRFTATSDTTGEEVFIDVPLSDNDFKALRDAEEA